MRLFKRIKKKLNFLGRKHRCYICKVEFSHFLPFRQGWPSLSPVLRQLNVIGSDVENFACPACRCTDRERHLLMYFDVLGLWEKAGATKVLHFAPEHYVAQRIDQARPAEYIRGDLFPTVPEVMRIDITEIPFANDYFDMVVCNHVLEHVPDDKRALAEIFRVLKPGGFAVLQTPYSPVLRWSWEDVGISHEQDRWFCFGQEDHVRLYGNDFFERVTDAGLKVQRKAHDDLLKDLDSEYYGVNGREDLILAFK